GRLADEADLALVGVDQGEVSILPGDGQGYTGEAGSGTHVEHLPADQPGSHREAVEHVPWQQALDVAARGQVEHAVPLRDPPGELEQPLRLAAVERNAELRGLIDQPRCITEPVRHRARRPAYRRPA